jgi:hypothetical protein
MKLTDLWNSFSRHGREISNWLNHPVDNIKKIGERWGQRKVEEIEVPVGNNHRNSDTSTKINSNQTEEHQYLITSTSGTKSKIINNHNGHTTNGVNGHTRKLSDLSVGKSFVVTKNKEEISLLTPSQNIQSFKGRYRIGKLIKPIKDNTIIREYEGYTFPHNQLILVKEYLLLEKDFSDSEAEKRQRELLKRANIKLKSTQIKNGISGQDFRLITPLDAFDDHRRCYIISDSNQNYETLKEYLNENISMSYEQVRILLKQVLQSLYFLHNQNIILGNSEAIPGLAHGNINVDSLLCDTKRSELFIYLSDFALWEDIFKPQSLKSINEYSSHSMFQKDLKDLGYVAIKCLFWNHIIEHDINLDEQINIKYLLSSSADFRLNEFIEKLIGIDRGFKNTKEAFEEISKLPFEPRQPQAKLVEPNSKSEENKKPDFSKLKLLFLLLLSFGLIAFIASLLLKNSKNDSSTVSTSENAACPKDSNFKCSIKDASDNKPFNASIIADSMVSDWMEEKNLVSYQNNFKKELEDKYQVTLTLNIKKIDDIDEIEKQLEDNEGIDFAIANLSNQSNKKCENDALLSNGKQNGNNTDGFNKFKCKIIAYDGIVFFVPFSDANGENSIPKALKGRINKDNLAKLYQETKTEKITNWNQLGLKNSLPVKLYKPEEDYLIESFVKFIKKPGEPTTIAGSKTKFDSMLQNILQSFEENKDGGIGFGLLRKVYGQCSVYPLAIEEVQPQLIQVQQPLVQNDGNPINPDIDLCNDKGSYRLNTKAFKSEKYPLRFAIAVIYRTNNKTKGEDFAQMMLSDEGQSLLQEIGLVPARNIYSK